MVRRFVGILFIPVLALAVAPASALARTVAVQATDPSANTPAGVIYSIPLDSARQDAAPHRNANSGAVVGAIGGSSGGGTGGGTSGGGGGSSGPGAAGGTGGTNGAGTGVGVAPAGNGHAATRNPTVLVPGGQPGSLIHSANGFGSSSSVPGLDSPPSVGLGAVQSNASSAPVLALLLAAVLLSVGGYVGARAWGTLRLPWRKRLKPPH